MIYTDTQPTVNLTSRWRCNFYYALNGQGLNWYIAEMPTTDSVTVTFAVKLPFDAYVHRAWLSMKLSSPLTGSAIQRVNGIAIPSSGEVDIDGFDPTATTYQATFEFKAYGAVYESAGWHESRLQITDLTLNVDYTSLSQPEEPGEGGSIANRPIDTGVQLPRLLGEGFREVARIDPSRLKLEMKLDPLSKATMEIPPGGAEVKVKDFVELFSPHGSVGLFRATEVETRYGYNAGQTVYLEHALGTLADSIALGTQSISAPVATIFATLLGSQNVRHWVLGDCEVPEDYEMVYQYGYKNLLQTIIDLTQQLPDGYAWEFDTLRYPFVMHLRKMPEDDSCEVRLSRNLTTATLSIDTSGLCTRVFPFGSGEGADRVTLTNLIGTQYLDSPNADVWGYVSQTFTADEIYDALTLKDVAQRYLDRHDHPMVSVSMDAMDLFAATGETFDLYRLGGVCRLALPDYGVTMRERIISITWQDVYGRPETVDVTLANRLRDTSDEIAELLREASGIKLLGGTVDTVEESARAGSITPVSPFVQTFDVTGYETLLNVKTAYRCVTSEGNEVDCTVTVDGTVVPTAESQKRVLDITRYLESDENGVPLVGQHKLILQPSTINTMKSDVDNTITIKQIKKR